MDSKGKYEESKVLWLATLEWSRRILGEERKNTLGLLHAMVSVLQKMKG